MNINIGDTVYIRCISQPPMDITTIVAKKELMKTEKQSGSGLKRTDT